MTHWTAIARRSRSGRSAGAGRLEQGLDDLGAARRDGARDGVRSRRRDAARRALLVEGLAVAAVLDEEVAVIAAVRHEAELDQSAHSRAGELVDRVLNLGEAGRALLVEWLAVAAVLDEEVAIVGAARDSCCGQREACRIVEHLRDLADLGGKNLVPCAHPCLLIELRAAAVRDLPCTPMRSALPRGPTMDTRTGLGKWFLHPF